MLFLFLASFFPLFNFFYLFSIIYLLNVFINVNSNINCVQTRTLMVLFHLLTFPTICVLAPPNITLPLALFHPCSCLQIDLFHGCG